MLSILVIYSIVGGIAGIMAGLLGIGGGLVIVPMLVYCFSLRSIDTNMVMHIALGTSMASIMFTSVSSFMSHHRRGAVIWPIVKKIALGIVVGTFIGSYVVSGLSTNALKIFFVVFLYFVATQMLLNRKPRPSRQMPGSLGMFGAGNVIGAVSSFVGIGGGTLSVPFMIWHNVPAHQAVGTSAAIGFPIAIAGTVGYIVNGMKAQGLPEYSLGYVYLPALLGIVIISVLTAPLGVKLAHSLPVDKLKKIFAFFLYMVGTRMLFSLL